MSGCSILQTVEEKVRERLKKYLSRDEDGVRRLVLNMFLTGGKYTTNEIFRRLEQEEYDVSYRGVSAMVGLMNTRLGILSINVTGDHNTYSLKDNYRDIVNSIIEQSR